MSIKDNSIYIKGFGNELQIGFIDDDEYRLIMKDKKNVKDAIENVSERNEFLHLYGPDLDDCYFKNRSEEVIEIDHLTDKYTPSNKIPCWTISMEACVYYKSYFLDQIDELIFNKNEEWFSLKEGSPIVQVFPFFDSEVNGDNLKTELNSNFGNLFIEKPKNKIFLIQKHVEKGYWGSFEAKNYSDSILLLGLEIEGYTKTLLGYFYNEKNIVRFKKYSTNEVDTEGKSDAYEVYSSKNGYENIY